MFKRVLMTTDGSELAEEALPAALALAQSSDAELLCLAVVDPPPVFGPAGASLAVSSPFYEKLEGELQDLAKAAADRMVKKAEKAGVRASAVVRSGSVVEQVVAEAKSWPADVIVMSTHGRTGISRFLLGSVAGRIANQAPCPVLLHRTKDTED